MLYYIENREEPITYFCADSLTNLPHIHPHLELIYMMEGSSLAIVDDREFLIESGDLFLSFPNQIHAYHPCSDLKCHILIFSPDLFSDLKRCFWHKLPVSPIIPRHLLAPQIPDLFTRIKEGILSHSSYDNLAAKGYLMALLGTVLPRMELTDVPTHHDSLKDLLTYCLQNYTEPLTLDSVSAHLHLNKYYISHLFKERMHMGFTDFVNQLRIEHACSLLTKDANIAEAAFASGFSSIRTFNRVFGKNMGMTPRDYQKSRHILAH